MSTAEGQKAPPPQKAPQQERGAVIDLPAAARPARPARPRSRHRLAAVSFGLCVVLPAAAATAYLYGVAADQYGSTVAFSVRASESVAPSELLGSLTRSFVGAGPDARIIYEFVRSQAMVEAAVAALPLREIWNVPQDDIVFRLGEERPIEDVVDYWNWMTSVSFDAAAGIVHFEARAFDPASAHAIASFVLERSTDLVNNLSERAREDAVSVAREVLADAEARLRDARLALRAFRDIEQQLDPSETGRAALTLVATLEGELARAQIELDTQRALVGERSPRIPALRQRIESLQTQIATERARMGAGEGGPEDSRAYADLLAEYEALSVDQEFAQNAYVSALSSYEQALLEARRQMRYLSPHIAPTTSVEPQYPQRALIAALVALLLAVAWGVAVLVLYNIRDRR